MRANRSGRLLPRMPGTSKTTNRLRWPVELRGSPLSPWWLKLQLQAPGTQALQPSSSMWRGQWRPVLVRSPARFTPSRSKNSVWLFAPIGPERP